mgnify:CR=1 FL=1
MKNIDLTKEPVRKAFMHYLIPAVLATMVTSIYIPVSYTHLTLPTIA